MNENDTGKKGAPVQPAMPPEPMAQSDDALSFVQAMQEECKDYDVSTDEGKEKVRAYLSRWSPEERRQMARRIMADLMAGRTRSRPGFERPSSEPRPPAKP